MKAKNEGEALQHMSAMFNQSGGKLSGKNVDWVDAKVSALNVLHNDWLAHQDSSGEVPQFLDVGIGDMMHWERWQPFDLCGVEYLGVDACPDVLKAMRAKHSERDNVLFLELAFSELVDLRREGHTWPVDCIVMLDVLYHVPSDDVHEGLLDMLFMDGSHRYVLVSYATDQAQRFDGAKGIGQPGFAWFPRRWREPEGWTLLHRADFKAAGAPQRQQLSLYKRG